MRTVGAGTKAEKPESVTALEAENRRIREANKDAAARISELEGMLYESHEQAAGLQMQLEASQDEAAGLRLQLEASRGEAAELQARIDGIGEQDGMSQKPKGGKEKSVGK